MRHRSTGTFSRVVRLMMLVFGAAAVAAVVTQSAAGAGWSFQPVPNPARSSEAELNSVSCTSMSDCVAVGFRDIPVGGGPVPLVERWDGATWSTDHTPTSTVPGWAGWLSSVSCTSVSACLAVGLSYSENSPSAPLAERWDGSAWSLVPVPRLGDAETLESVSCVSSTDCLAVGYGRSSVVARWDGARWSARDIRFGRRSARPSALTSVSCTPGGCAAAGWDNVGPCGRRDGTFYSLPVLGFWTQRTFSLRRYPNVACSSGTRDSGGDDLNGVACSSRLACMAVGTGVYRWDGRHWSTQPPPIGAGELRGVACASTKACTAVGSRVYTWNGRRWSSVPILYPSRGSDPELTGVSCPSRRSCVAVGSYIDGAGGASLLVESVGMRAELGGRLYAPSGGMNIPTAAVLVDRIGAAVVAPGVKAFLAL